MGKKNRKKGEKWIIPHRFTGALKTSFKMFLQGKFNRGKMI
jgi:hypothetical protein|tara:strand:- start:174 stop:296 length:123 start_codon:yes stop_codon:yes gene_type:complete